MSWLEQYYQRIQNSNAEKLLYRYEYLILLAVVETVGSLAFYNCHRLFLSFPVLDSPSSHLR